MNNKKAFGIQPEIVAAICAATAATLADEREGVMLNVKLAVKIKHTDHTWLNYGRQKIMDNRSRGGL